MTLKWRKGCRKLVSESARVVQPLEYVLEKRGGNRLKNGGPVFIVGAPRCGSTLLYQVLVDLFDFSYFSNFTAQFYHSPRVGFRSEKMVRSDRNLKFNLSSQYGMTSGLWGPHECGKFWRRWFPDDRDFVDEDEYSRERFASLEETVADISGITGKPLLIKNLNCGQRLRVLRKCFPRALIIFCKRDPFFTAQSILVGRKQNNNNLNAWWSVRPRNFRELEKLPYIDQIAHQVIGIEKQIEGDIKDFEGSQVCPVIYEEFCSETDKDVSRLEWWWRGNGLTVRRRGGALPELKASNSLYIGEEEARMLQAALAKAKREYHQWT